LKVPADAGVSTFIFPLALIERSFYYFVMPSVAKSSSANLSSLSKPTKGEETRSAILDAAVRLAATDGFAALTIGVLAEKTGMSKSGLFAHFGSKEELQIATLDEATRIYNEVAFIPALRAPRGLKRLEALAENWLLWTERSTLQACPIMAALAEFDDKPGAVRDALLQQMQRMNDEIIRAVQMTIDAGEFAADTDAAQFAFEMFGVIATCYRSRSLFRDPKANDRARAAFRRLIQSCLPPRNESQLATRHSAAQSA
jgi:AcrR family transcriptional regulator